MSNERSLVKLVLLQTIASQAQTAEALGLIVQAIINLLKAEQTSADDACDTEFECLEQLLDKLYRPEAHIISAAYPQELKERIASVLVNELPVRKPANQIRQVWIALSFRVLSTKLTQARNAFYSYL